MNRTNRVLDVVVGSLVATGAAAGVYAFVHYLLTYQANW